METEIRNMKRKELQALCKQHKIPANLTNYEMANQLILLHKETGKPISKGKSCLRSTVEQASDDLSDGANRLSKKVRFSPENETFEFQASETKPEDKGRGARARKRSMMRRVEGNGGIVLGRNADVFESSEYIVKNPVRGTRSRAAKVAQNVESVPTVETRMRTRRSSESKEVENKDHVKDDKLLKKNPTKRTSRNKGVITEDEIPEIVTEKVGRRSKRNAKQSEDGAQLNQGLSDIEVVERGRTKRQRSQLVQNAKVPEAASEAEIELQVVLQIDEPPVRSSRYGTRRQSTIPQAQNTRTGRAKDETGTNTLVQGTAFDHNARSKRTSSRKPVAVSDALVIENPVDNKPKNSRRGRVLEEQKDIIEGSPLVEEPPRKSSRQANKRNDKNTGGHESKDENDKNTSKSSVVGENVDTRRISSRRKSIVTFDTIPVGNVRKSKATSGSMDPVLEEENVVIEEGSSLVAERSRKSTRKSIVTSDTIPVGSVRKSKATSRRLDPVLEEENTVIEEGSSLVVERSRKSTRRSAKAQKSLALSDKTGEKNTEFSEISQRVKGDSQEIMNLEKVFSLKIIGLEEAASEAAKLQNNHLETEGLIGTSGLSDFEVVLNINTENQADKESVLEDSHFSPELEMESNVPKNAVLAEASLGENGEFDQPDCLVKQAGNEDLEKELEVSKNNELEPQASGSLKFKNDEEETRTVIGTSGFYIELNIDKEAETSNDKLSQDCAANEDNSDSVGLALVKSDRQSDSGFKMISDDDSETEEDEENLVEERKSSDDDSIANSSALLASEKPNESEDVVCPGATLEEGYPQIDQSVSSGISEEKIKLQMDMEENTELVKLTESSNAISNDEDESETSNDIEGNHSPEVDVLDKSYGEKNTPSEAKSIERHELERSAMVNAALEFSIGKEQPSGEPKVYEEIEHNVKSPLALPKGISSMDHLGIASSEPEDSYVHIPDRNEITPSKMEESVTDEAENPATIEPKNGQEWTDELDGEGNLAQDNTDFLHESVPEKNFESVHEGSRDSSSLDTSGQNESTAFEVEDNRTDDVETSAFGSELRECTSPQETAPVMNSSSAFKVMPFADHMLLNVDNVESGYSPSMTSRDDCSLKEQHSRGLATPISVSNEIKSLMMINLDDSPAFEFGEVRNDPMLQEDHVPTVEPAEDLNNVFNENIIGAERFSSPLPQEINLDKHSSFTLWEDADMEKPESSVFAENLARLEAHNSADQGKKQNSDDDCSTETKKSEDTENEFDAFDGNLIASQEGHISGEQSGKQSLEDDSSTEPAESEDSKNELDADSNKVNAEDETQPFETTSPQMTGRAEYQEEETNRKAVIEEGSPRATEHEYADTQVIGSCGDDGLTDTHCIETGASPSALTGNASACEFGNTKNLPEEEIKGIGKMVSEHEHDSTLKVMSSLGESGIIADKNAVDNSTLSFGQADIFGNDSEDVLMERGDGITRIQKEPASLESGGVAMELAISTSTALDMTDEEKNEDLNVFEQSEGVETQFDDGMLDGLLGYEMEMVQEPVHAEKRDSPCHSDHFSGRTEAAMKDNSSEEDEIRIEGMPVKSNETSEFDECLGKAQNLTSRADGDDVSHCGTSNVNDVVQCAKELKEFAENQCWSPELGLGNSQASSDSNMFGGWDFNLFSQGEAKESTSVVSKVSFAVEHESVAEEQVVTASVPQSSNAASCNATLNEVYDLKETEDQIFVEDGNIGDTGAEVMVHEEAKRCEVSISVVSGLEGTEDGSFLGGINVVDTDVEEVVAMKDTCEASKISDLVIGDRPSEYADKTFHGGDAGTSLDGNMDDLEMFDDKGLAEISIFPTEENNTEVHMQVTRDISLSTKHENYQQELSEDVTAETEISNSAVKEGSPTEDIKKNFELVNKENAFGTQSCLFLGTPMKQATHFDMKKNPSSVKREIQGSVAAKSTAKRRALTEIQK